MDKTKFKQIDETIKALNKELKPISDELGELYKSISEVSIGNNNHPLIQLTSRTTKTARRHDCDKKVKIDNNKCIVGTNHQGIGYQYDYSSQLSPLSDRLYTTSEQNIRTIYFDKDAVLDLTSIIKKSNQKIFLKMLKVINKYELKQSFNTYRKENLDKIEVPILDNEYKIVIGIDRGYQTTFWLIKNNERKTELFSIDLEHDTDQKPKIEVEKEKHDILKEISEVKYSNDISINDVKQAIFLTDHKDALLEAIKSKREALKGIREDYTNEYKQLNELLQPLLALENL